NVAPLAEPNEDASPPQLSGPRAPGCQACTAPAGSLHRTSRLAAVKGPDGSRSRSLTRPLAAVSQPSLSVASTGTAGQSRFCTTAVGASTNFAEGEYSIRTSDGVRNSKRAFPTTITGEVCGFAQEPSHAPRSPIPSHVSACRGVWRVANTVHLG